jgi:hypothetical protein
MAAGKYNFTIEQGATVDFEIVYKDSDNQPIDVNNYTGRMQIKDKPGGNITHITLTNTTATDGTGLSFSNGGQGKIKVFISAHSSSLLDFTKAFYDLEIATNDTYEVVTRLLQGTVTLDKDVTTATS